MQMSSWYLTNGNWRLGPLTIEQAMAALQRPDAGLDVYAWREGFDAWLRVDAVPELASLHRPPPPVPLVQPLVPQPQPPIPPGWPGAHANQPGHLGYAPAPVVADVETPWFLVGSGKLLVMSVCTLGLYEVYWCYQHWKRVRDVQNDDVSPLPRAIFAIIFCFPLFDRVSDQAADRGLEHAPSPKVCAALFILLSFAWRLPDPLWLAGFFSVLPLIPIQRAATALALDAVPHADPNTRVTGLNWVAVVLGSLILLIAILGMMIPEPS
jgi:hypothetical protein